mgnify:CR=1 FL=1|jgi:hypothetical protein
MKIQELRIGNWFIGYNGKKFQWSLGHFGLLTLKKNRPEIDDIIKSPIPLTEEMLSEFTMKWGTDPQEPNALMVFKNGEFEILKFKDEDHFFYSNGRGFHADIIYLHQLQNLFFDLTGEELEVEL